MADPALGSLGFGTPFAAAIDFLRRKLDLPTERWDDIARSAHDRAFIVAGAAMADLLADLKQAVIDAGSGGGLAGFRKDFDAIVARSGWTGWTGEGSSAGVAWRTAVIYRTNMAGSYAAGRWQQLNDPEFARLMPWWRYRHADGVMHPRPQHVAWNGLTLPREHPFWKTHFPPNGWGCHCKVFAEKAPAEGAPAAPPAGWDQADPKTGAPPGIDVGFDYASGANAATPLRELIDAKLIKLDAPIGAAMWAVLEPALALERQQQWWQTLDAWLADPLPRGRSEVLGAIEGETLDALRAAELPEPANAAIALRDALVSGAKQRRHLSSQDGLSVEDWRALPTLLASPANVYWDIANGKLVYVADGIGPAKIVVEFVPATAQGEPAEVAAAFRTSAQDVAGMVKAGLWTLLH